MSRMIPLKIADMAVAACNEEIAKHLLEIGRLQGRVIALEGQLEGEKAIAKALRSLSFMTAVPSEDYEKLKADLEKSDGVVFTQAVENERLKAEVERLDTGIQPEGSNDAVGRAVELLLEKEKEIDRLKAEVERLRKAGDAMADKASLAGCSECFGMFNDLEKSLDEWNAAREGKPSV